MATGVRGTDASSSGASAAGLAAGLAALLVVSAAGVAAFRHALDTPAAEAAQAHEVPPERPEPRRFRVADGLRDDAKRACDQGLWTICLNKLEKARAVDPSGETSLEVQTMRRAIASAPPGGPGSATPRRP